MHDQRPAVPALSYRLHVVLLVVAVALTACGGGGGGASPGLTPTVSPPPINPPSQFATGGKSFTAGSDRSLALPLYGISLPFAAVVAPGSIFAGRRLETDNSISLTFESAAGAERSVRFGATGVLPFLGTSGDVDYLEFGAIGSTPTLLNFSRFGALSFTVPTSQVVAFYGGFETPAGAGPTSGTLSYQGATIANEVRGGNSFALAGSIHLEADFQSNTMFGSINNLKRFDDNGNPVVGVNGNNDYDYRFILSGVTIANAGGSRTFTGGLIAQKLDDGVATSTTSTLIDGRFFGSTAQEAAGVWQAEGLQAAGGNRDIWGSFAGTTSAINGTANFLQSVGTPISLTETASFEVNVLSNAVTHTALGAVPTITPLADGGLTFSGGALGTFNPPGSSTSPALSSTTAYVASSNAIALTGATTAGVPSIVYLAERGTLSYSRFGYWIDGSRVSSNDILGYTYFAGGVQTPTGSMPSSGTANYAGTTLGRVIDNTNAEYVFAGKVNLTANFGASTVTGSVHTLTGSTPALLTSINLDAGVIAGSAFSGTANALNGVNSVGTGTWNGRFHGPAADEVAGSYTLNGGGGSLQGWGSFGAGR